MSKYFFLIFLLKNISKFLIKIFTYESMQFNFSALKNILISEKNYLHFKTINTSHLNYSKIQID